MVAMYNEDTVYSEYESIYELLSGEGPPLLTAEDLDTLEEMEDERRD